MNGLKKTLNVFGILLAWILSIALVVLLIAAPSALSALSLLEPETITDVLWTVLEEGDLSAAAPQQQLSYGVTNLSAKKEVGSSESSVAKDILEDLDVDKIEELIGGQIDEDLLQKVIASDAVKEIVEAYVEDVADAITGAAGKNRFTAEKIIQVVEENIDEIAEVIQEVAPDLSKDDIKELKSEIVTVVRDNAEQIVEQVPSPEEIRDAVIDEGVAGAFILALLGQINTFKLMIVGAAVLLSLLIFLLRLPGFRGFRWLSVDLFVAAGFNGLIGGGLMMAGSALVEAVEEEAAVGVVKMLLSTFTGGVLIRTGIILLAAVLLLVAYILIKVLRRKKSAVPTLAPAAAVQDCAPASAVVPESAAEPAETAPEQNC